MNTIATVVGEWGHTPAILFCMCFDLHQMFAELAEQRICNCHCHGCYWEVGGLLWADAAGVDTVHKETESAFGTFNYRGQGKASVYRSGMGRDGQIGYAANTSLVEDSEQEV